MGAFLKVLSSALVGAMLFALGCSAQSVGDQTAGSILPIRAMNAKRAAHTATLLSNDKVLLTGGYIGGDGNIASAELFDPTSQTFTAIANMSVSRSGHTATQLANGKVLIAGGFNGDYLNTTELFDPATNRFEQATPMTVARSGHVATLLKDGTVLMVGGVGVGWTFLASAEIYDPRTRRFTPTSAMSIPRESHTATLLKDGRVLISGGHKDRRSAITIFKSAEIYDPVRKIFTAAGDLNTKRHKHEAVLLADGRVLIIGGSDERDGDGAYRNAEIFDPAVGKFTAISQNMNQARYKLQGTAVRLSDGRVLIAGGSDRAEIFDPATKSFALADGSMGTKRLFATATLLRNGQVLIAGGYHQGNSVSDGAWIFRI